MSRKPSRTAALQILVLNGVNLDLLGTREPEIYGTATLDDIAEEMARTAPGIVAMLPGARRELEITWRQTNSESEACAILSERKWSGCLINPGAWTHTSLALVDRLRGLSLAFVEVHLSNTSAREEFRRHSYFAPAAIGSVSGFGAQSYMAGLLGLLAHLTRAA